jgi:uncharacterized protein YbjT (DUF2867 family)
MPVKTVTVIGATGLIGGHLVRLLQAESSIETIRIPVRRPVSISGPKLAINLIDFADPESFKLAIDGSDAVFCAVGTTQKKVKGDKEAYRKVDYDIPVHAARFCAETGCQHFLLVSSVGANSSSSNFYLKLKGRSRRSSATAADPTNRPLTAIHSAWQPGRKPARRTHWTACDAGVFVFARQRFKKI